MKAVWSFWTKPWRERRGLSWFSERHHLLAWILSVETARQHYPRTTLVTDDAGARLLVDGLGLNFATVSTALNCLDHHDASFWTLGKLHAYRAQTEPFVHLDTDVFLWKKLPEYIEKAAVFAQNPEPFVISAFTYRPEEVRRALTQETTGWVPPEWEWALSMGEVQSAACCGVLGGHLVEFLRYYSELAIRLIEDPRNQPGWAMVRPIEHNCLVEQYHLSVCAAYHRHRKDSPFRDVEIRHLFDPWTDAFDPNIAAKMGYTHLQASAAKQDPRVADRLERRVQRDYPELYARHFGWAKAGGRS